MRYLLLASILLLSGCAEFQKMQEEERMAYIRSLDTQCRAMGYNKQDDAHRNCILMLNEQRKVARQRESDAQMGMAVQLLNSSGPRTLSPPQVTCNSVPTGNGTYRSVCQ